MASRHARGKAEAKTDWEDKYCRLKSEYEELQAHCNKQTEDVRKYDDIAFYSACYRLF